MVTTHEIGHNLGENHGHGLECGASVVTTACLGSKASIEEYGASYDVMGNNWTGAVSWMALPHQLNLGWLAAAGRVVTVRYPGPSRRADFVVEPIERASGTVGVVVDTPTRKYYLEARSAVGQDAFLVNWPSATSGVHISMRNDVPASTTGFLTLDTHPGAGLGNQDFFDAALSVGETFTDVDGRFALTVDGVSASGLAFHLDPLTDGDTTPPDTTITSGPPTASGSSSATFAFASTEAGSTFECRLDAGPFAPCSSPHPLTGLADGQHAFSVRATDPFGNTDASPATRVWTVDTAPPETTITSGPPTTSGSGAATFAFSSSEAGSTFECRLDAGPFAPCSSPHPLTGLADGQHAFSVRATDPFGNTDASPATRVWTVDTAPPETTITSGPPTTSGSGAATFAFSSSEAGSRLSAGSTRPPSRRVPRRRR